MIVKKIFLPGQFDDAYVYMGWLHIAGVDRTLTSLDLAILAESLDRRFPRSMGLHSYAFARNDWLAGEHQQKLLTNRAMRKAFGKAIRRIPAQIEIDPKELQSARRHELQVGSGDLLDWHFYGQRLYVGTSDALFHAEVSWDRELTVARSTKRSDARCVAISAKYGAVTASAGLDGMQTLINEFDQTTNKQLPPTVFRSTRSFRTSWLGFDMVNYGGGNAVAYYKAEHEKVPTSRYNEVSLVTGLSADAQELRLPAADEHAITFAFNSGNTVYFQDSAGSLFRSSLRAEGQANLALRRPTRTRAVEKIISAHPMKYGVVAETYNEVILLSRDAVQRLTKAPAISVRTFTSSKRFQNLVTIVDERGLSLISVLEVPVE